MTYDLTTIDIETLMKESQTILETLPLADYLKVSTIKVDFDKTTDTSYFTPADFRIVVAFKNIFESIVASKKSVITDLELEKIIRNFLYHEISHAILTPRVLMPDVDDWHNNGYLTLLTPDFANIIEDERIETILKNYYYGVDFKKNITTLCQYQEPTSFKHFVFNCVRLRKSPIQQEFVNGIVNDFINSTKNCSAYSGDEWTLATKMNLLLEGLKVIWDEYQNQQSQENQSNSSSKEDENEENTDSSVGNSSKEESEDTDSEETESSKEDGENESQDSSKEENKDEEDSSSKEEESENADEDSSKEENESGTEDAEPSDESEEDAEDESLLSQDEIKEIMGRAIKELKETATRYGSYSLSMKDYNTTSELTAQLLKIIVKNVGVGVQESQAQYGYCGRFSAKRFMKDHNDSYKWFEKHAIEGNTTTKKSSKKILNIWLDQSGSFCYNDEEVNKVLKSLYEIEKRRNDFEWNLVRVDEHFIIENNKEKRYSYSRGGNALPKSEIENCYRQLNKTKQEYNIILFDGEVGTLPEDCYRESLKPLISYENLSVFNNKRSIFIIEKSNKAGVNRYCPNARDIIIQNNDYANALKNNVCKALDLLF